MLTQMNIVKLEQAGLGNLVGTASAGFPGGPLRNKDMEAIDKLTF